MKVKDNQSKYFSLRNNYPFFCFENLNVEKQEGKLIISFEFNLNNSFTFKPKLEFPLREFYIHFEPDHPAMQNFAFQLGMIELISYWKAGCAPVVIIKPFKLNEEQIRWWKKLYYHGLGEFFYLNGIEAGPEDFMMIKNTSAAVPEKPKCTLSDKTIVPVGGGKDSVVTLELFKASDNELIPFVINPNRAQTKTIENAGFSLKDCIHVRRTIDPELLRLNRKGFLNGHTPFSAVVAFNSVLGAYLSGARYVALSNESSANEATIPGTKINHQYSKSFEFEKDFRDYIKTELCDEIEYFSFLRPLNELQISSLFAGLKHQHADFRSCNKGSKNGAWCGRCPKCLFTYIMLTPFLDKKKLIGIFGKDMLNDQGLLQYFRELSGLDNTKPFECVGTIDEVNAALKQAAQKQGGKLPELLRYYTDQIADVSSEGFYKLLKSTDEQNFLPVKFEEILNKAGGWTD